MSSEQYSEFGQPAGFWLRVWAKLIDSAVLNVLWVTLVFVLVAVNSAGVPAILLFPVVVVVPGFWFGYFTFLTSRGRQTIGYVLVGAKVTSADGNDISVGRAFGRTLLNTVFLALTAYYIGYVDYLSVMGREKRSLHDRLTDTYVVRVSAPRVRRPGVLASASFLIVLALVLIVGRTFVAQSFYIPSGAMQPTLVENDRLLSNNLYYHIRDPKAGDIVLFKSPPGASLDGQERIFIKRVIGTPGDVIRVTPGYVMIHGEKYGHGELRSALSRDSSSPDMVAVKLAKDGAIVDGKFLSIERFAERLGWKDAKAIEIVPGLVYRNGKALDEPYTQEDPDKAYPNQDTNPKWLVKQEGLNQVKIPDGLLLVMGDNRNNSNDGRYWGLLDRERLVGRAMFRFWPLNRIGSLQ